jgi:AAA domain, putative AbiEii toxin, Type IV TA system/AAA ATPase domain
MLTRVDIANYRGFKTYRMDGLSRVNLLVGKNNSGKTALLEGLQFLTSGGDITVLADAAQRRGEVILTRPDRSVRFEISHFFHGHTLALDAAFSMNGENGYPPVSAKVVALSEGKKRQGEGAHARPAGPAFAIKITGVRTGEHPEQIFRLTREGGLVLEEGGYYVQPDLFGGEIIIQRRLERGAVRFISTDSLNTATLAGMRDEVILAGQEREVDDALRILEPSLESVHMLTGMLPHAQVGSRAGAVVGIKGQQGRVPLGSMGDGMRRLLALSTSLVCTKEGSLFVDEIDTGLHYSVMADMWKLVVRKALSSNVQVFATTHSWDCIEGLALLCQKESDLADKVAVHKIDRNLENSVGFPGSSIVKMVKSDIDPR